MATMQSKPSQGQEKGNLLLSTFRAEGYLSFKKTLRRFRSTPNSSPAPFSTSREGEALPRSTSLSSFREGLQREFVRRTRSGAVMATMQSKPSQGQEKGNLLLSTFRVEGYLSFKKTLRRFSFGRRRGGASVPVELLHTIRNESDLLIRQLGKHRE
jgi:hypothetical protein